MKQSMLTLGTNSRKIGFRYNRYALVHSRYYIGLGRHTLPNRTYILLKSKGKLNLYYQLK